MISFQRTLKNLCGQAGRLREDTKNNYSACSRQSPAHYRGLSTVDGGLPIQTSATQSDLI